jgi:hypothetical protein
MIAIHSITNLPKANIRDIINTAFKLLDIALYREYEELPTRLWRLTAHNTLLLTGNSSKEALATSLMRIEVEALELTYATCCKTPLIINLNRLNRLKLRVILNRT